MPRLAGVSLLWIAACDASCNSAVEVSYEYEYADAGPHPPPLPTAPSITREQALEVYKRFKDACIRKDAQALWDLLADSSKEDLDAAAARARAIGAATLKEVVGYTGPLESFGALENLRSEFKLRVHLCSNAENWSFRSEGQRGSEHLIIVELGMGPQELYLQKSTQGAIHVRPAGWHNVR
jgi:hypothetical protein